MDSMTVLIISLEMCLICKRQALSPHLLSPLPKPKLLANCGPSQRAGHQPFRTQGLESDRMQIICLLCYFGQITEKSLNNINTTINKIAIISISQDCCEGWMK